MSNFNGYRASKMAGGGLYNGYVTPKAKQVWEVGAIVNIGFIKGLEVVGKRNSEWLLRKGAALYSFEPHMGISRVN